MSDDRRHAVTLIGFIGSVFSPYYARARRRGVAHAANHSAINVAIYGEDAKRWAMTERSRPSLLQSADALVIGPSAMSWDGNVLTVDIDEISVPIPKRIRGRIRLIPDALSEYRTPIDDAGRHWWGPIAPSARIEVKLDCPSLHWSGTGYFDSNDGLAPLEDDFVAWNWSRSHHNGSTSVFYDIQPRVGRGRLLSLAFDSAGRTTKIDAPSPSALATTLWRIDRQVRLQGDGAKLVRTLEDTPFYTRSLIAASRDGQSEMTVHESLSLDRFRSAWVQALLPFRMPRRQR